ncbi:hypothetical protein BH09SUM1_BH09SUM1_12220 [soil metagenome]
MTTLTLTVSDEVKSLLESAALRGGYESIDAYVSDLVSAEPDSYSTLEELDALLEEGMKSGPAEPMTSNDWEYIRSEVQKEIGSLGHGNS